jgi:integrase
MGVYARPDSPYWWLFLETAPKGKQRVKTTITKGTTTAQQRESKKLAEEEYHTRMTELTKQKSNPPPEPPPPIETFATFASWYDTHHIARHEGCEREREILKILRKFFDPYPLDQITHTLVTEWRTTRLATGTSYIRHTKAGPKRVQFKPPSARTVNREVDLLKQIMEGAVDAKKIAKSPIYRLTPLVPIDPIRRIMSEDEERLLLPALPADVRAMVIAGTDALPRLKTILDLRWADDHGTTLDLRQTKNGKSHTVPISSRLRAALDALPRTDAYMFPARRTCKTAANRRSMIARVLREACERAQLPYGRKDQGITFHWATRRTGASRIIRKGGEKVIAIAQQLGNWKDAKVLIGIYQETTTADMIAAVESIAPKAIHASFTDASESSKSLTKNA